MGVSYLNGLGGGKAERHPVAPPIFLFFYSDTIILMHKPRIGVLRGGPSNEYDVSLNSGAAVLDALRKRLDHLYQARDILIDKKGVWHLDGVAFPENDIASKIDVAFNALHGAYGEDGKIQAFLEAHRMPFTGSGSLASAVGMNKILSKKRFADHGIKSPYWTEVSSERAQQEHDAVAKELFTTFNLPAVALFIGSMIFHDHDFIVHLNIYLSRFLFLDKTTDFGIKFCQCSKVFCIGGKLHFVPNLTT